MDTLKTNEELNKIISDNQNSIVVLKFSAQWCGPCRALANTINSLTAEETNGVKFYDVDVDEADEEFIEDYNIRNIPVMVYIKDGLIANKTVGLKTKQDILNIIEEIKNK